MLKLALIVGGSAGELFGDDFFIASYIINNRNCTEPFKSDKFLPLLNP